jgi:hypothetical protein
VGTKSSEVATPALRALVEVNTCTVQDGSLWSRKVTVPVGVCWLPTEAVLRTAVPTGPPAEGWEKTSGVTLAITMVKVWHAGSRMPSLAQTVVGPNVPAVVGTPKSSPPGSSNTPPGRVPEVREYVGGVGNPVAENRWR